MCIVSTTKRIVEFENAFHLFVGCSDHFMSGIEIEDIKFCPICGRKLVKECEDKRHKKPNSRLRRKYNIERCLEESARK